MTVNPQYRRAYRRYVTPDGKRYARSVGVPDIPFVPEVEPPPTIADVVTRLRARAFGAPTSPPNPRDALVYGITNALLIPGDPTTYVGVRPGISLTRYPASGEGNYTVPSGAANSVAGGGTPVENMEFYGTVNVGSLQNVLFRNCHFRGTLTWGANVGLVEWAGSLNRYGAVFEDCAFEVRDNNPWITGMRGGNYTCLRCEFIGCADSLSWNSSIGNVKLYGCYLHDGAYDEWASTDTGYPSQGSNYLHCDGIQISQGAGYYAIGCYIGGARYGAYSHHTGNLENIRANHDHYTSGVLAAQAAGGTLITGLIEQCAIEGGTATVNVSTSSSGYALDDLEFRDCIFPFRAGSAGSAGQWYILRPADCNAQFNNCKHPNGATVPIVTG